MEWKMQLVLVSLQRQLFELLKVQSSNKLQRTESSGYRGNDEHTVREELEYGQQSMFGRQPVAADVIGISLFRSQLSLFSTFSLFPSASSARSLLTLLLLLLTLHFSVSLQSLLFSCLI
jgi:hypothetical protein